MCLKEIALVAAFLASVSDSFRCHFHLRMMMIRFAATSTFGWLILPALHLLQFNYIFRVFGPALP
jgi:hypothetical protein